MKNLFLLITALICFGPAAALGYDILVVQGLAVKPYDDAVRGLRQTCDAELKRVQLAELKEKDVAQLVRKEKPRVVVAIGPEALRKVRGIEEVPVVYLMVVNPRQIVQESGNFTGVAMNAPPEKYFDLLERMSPKPATVGVLYDPAKSAHLVKRAQAAARQLGFVLHAKEVRSRKDVPAALNSIKPMVDALWMIPDTTVISPETVELFLLASPERNIPVITFAAKYVDMGALAALEIDSFGQGRQAGKMAADILAGKPVEDVPEADPRSTVKVNRHVAKKLGVTITQ